MSNTNPNFLDLDKITSAEVVVKFKGKEHKLAPITVDDFVLNTEALQEYAAKEDRSVRGEVDFLVKTLMRSFPTMEEADLRSLTTEQLRALQEFAASHNGQKKTEAQMVEDTEANPQTAG